ncbi:hypothetical protein GC170_20085 [bacterium]|nr:hypothetical protein [bacterium]
MSQNSIPNPGYRSQAMPAALLLILMGLWMTLFTLGSQVPSSVFSSAVLRYLTASTPNIILLGCVSGMIGVLKRQLNGAGSDSIVSDYVSGVISGFVTAIAVIAFPGVVSSLKISGQPLFVPDQGTYNVFSLVASYLAYQSGNDIGFSDRLTKRIFEFLKLG